MDHLWRALKEHISANCQFKNSDEYADFAAPRLRSLGDRETLRKAGVLSKHFWLRSRLK
jgi:hypothetical protein